MEWSIYLFALAGGLLSFFNPCSIVNIPSFISYVGVESTDARRGFFLSVAYGIGFALVFATIGIVLLVPAGLVFTIRHQSWLQVGGGIIIIAMGFLLSTGILKQNAGQSDPTESPEAIDTATKDEPGVTYSDTDGESQGEDEPQSRKDLPSYSRSFILGVSLATSGLACAGPILASVITAIIASGDRVGGSIALFIYALGTILPFLGIGAMIGKMNALLLIRMVRVIGPLQKIFGLVMIILGFVLIVWGLQALGII